MFREYRRAVVVVARIRGLYPGVRLRRKRSDYVRQRIVRQPAHATVVGLARPHPVTGSGWVTIRAVGASGLACIIPRRKQGASGADRQVRLPLRTCRSIGVQLERRAKGHTTVGGTDVIDVCGVTPGAVLVIDVVDDAVVCSRLTPPFVPPVAAVGRKDLGEVADSRHAWSWERCADEGLIKSGAAVGGLEEVIGVIVWEATTAFVHAGDVYVACNVVAGDLHVADKH